MIYNIFIVAFVVLAAIIPLVIYKNKIGEDRFRLILKILTVALFCLAILRQYLNDSFIWVINGGTYDMMYFETTDIFQSLLRWGMLFAFVVYPCSAFFKTKTLKNFAMYFCFPVALVSLCCYDTFLEYFTTPSGRAIMTGDVFRHIEFSLELILLLLVPLIMRFCLGEKFDVKNKTEWLNFFVLLPLGLMVTVPVVLPQSLFGFTDMFMLPLSMQNFLWIAVIFGLLIGIYFGFRFKDRETRVMICTFLALFLFLHYNSIYLMDFKMSRLPFQLCNLGSYLVLIALLIKKQSFFNFVLVANVAGAMIAFCVPDISEGMLSFWNIHFYIEHTWVFVVPLLMVALRVMERPKMNAIKHFFIGFSIYFAFCVVAGIIANCFLYIPYHPFYNKVNYFYIFDTTVLSALPVLSFTMKWAVTINGYTFYPIYMAVIYVLYSVYCLAFFFIFRQLCKMGDDHFKARQIRIDLYNKRGRYQNRRIPKKEYDPETPTPKLSLPLGNTPALAAAGELAPSLIDTQTLERAQAVVDVAQFSVQNPQSEPRAKPYHRAKGLAPQNDEAQTAAPLDTDKGQKPVDKTLKSTTPKRSAKTAATPEQQPKHAARFWEEAQPEQSHLTEQVTGTKEAQQKQVAQPEKIKSPAKNKRNPSVKRKTGANGKSTKNTSKKRKTKDLTHPNMIS